MHSESISPADPLRQARQDLPVTDTSVIKRSASPVLNTQGLEEPRVDPYAGTFLAERPHEDPGPLAIRLRCGAPVQDVVGTTNRATALRVDGHELVELIPEKVVLPQHEDGRLFSKDDFLHLPPFFGTLDRLLDDFLQKAVETSPAAVEFGERTALHAERQLLLRALDDMESLRIRRSTVVIEGRTGLFTRRRIQDEIKKLDRRLQADFRDDEARVQFESFAKISDKYVITEKHADLLIDEMIEAVTSESADFSVTWQLMETWPGKMQQSLEDMNLLMQRMVPLPLNEQTRGLAMNLIRELHLKHRSLCSLCTLSETLQFSSLLGRRNSVLEAAIASGNLQQTNVARMVLRGLIKTKLQAGVRQSWSKFTFFYRNIHLAEGRAVRVLGSDDQGKITCNLIRHYSGALQALYELVLVFPSMVATAMDSVGCNRMIDGASEAGTALKNQAVPTQSLPKNPFVESEQYTDGEKYAFRQGAAIRSEAFKKYLLSETDRMADHMQDRFTALMLILEEDENNDDATISGAASNRGRGLKSREEMQAWSEFFLEGSQAYAELQALARSEFNGKSAIAVGTGEVTKALQPWVDLYALAGDLLGRYSTQFCKPSPDSLRMEWLSDHMKMLENTRTARIVARGRGGSAVRLKISTSADATDRVEPSEQTPQLTIQEMSAAADRLIAKADREYGTSSTPASFFRHPMTYGRRLDVREMRADYHRALRHLDRMAKKPDVTSNPQLAASVARRIQKCWDRRAVLQAVLNSPQIEIPLQPILEPRWRAGLVRATRPDRGLTIVEWYETDEDTGSETFQQMIRVQLNDVPIEVVLDSGRPLEQFPVAPSFMHLHLRTTEETKIESLDQLTFDIIRWVRLKIEDFDNISNEDIRESLGVTYVTGTDASNEWGFEVAQQVRAQEAVGSTPADVTTG